MPRQMLLCAINLWKRVQSQTNGTNFGCSLWETSTGWIEHCRGLISVNLSAKSDPVSSSAAAKEATRLSGYIAAFDKLPARRLGTEAIYTELTSFGADYGPVFRGLEDCYVSGLEAVAKTGVPASTLTMPKNHEPQVIMHPAILD